MAKATASRDGRSVGELIEDAVGAALCPRPRITGDLPALPTFGGSGLLGGVDLDDRRSRIDVMDEGSDIDALR